jgi:lysophospholipase L1-like esterase
MRGRVTKLCVAFLLGWLACTGAAAQTSHWVGSWACSQQLPEPQNALAPDDLRDATLREVVHLSIGGDQIRVHISNAFGTEPLRLTAVHIARPGKDRGSIDASTDKALTFGGKPDVTVPAGAEYISDSIVFPATAFSDLAVSLHYDQPPAQQTGHPGSRATSYVVHGNEVSSEDIEGAKKVEHWYQLSGVDVLAPALAAAIVTLGDSITDGHGSTTDGNDRWPDLLARHLDSDSRLATMSVLNQGIGGNRLLLDGLGPNALARFDRDVLAQPGVRFLIVLEGVNDLGTLTRDHEVTKGDHEALVQRILSAYQQMALRAHAHGIRVIGATILPYEGSDYYHPGPASEADRQTINQWIRSAKDFDGVVDFDAVTRDPAHPSRLLPAFDSGDHLHPSPAGYKAMGEAIPLTLFPH